MLNINCISGTPLTEPRSSRWTVLVMSLPQAEPGNVSPANKCGAGKMHLYTANDTTNRRGKSLCRMRQL